ncbi:MAG: hypothetical protein AABW48_03865 [Nanoarchaeota archaeon]
MEQRKNDSFGNFGKKPDNHNSALDSEFTIKLKPRMVIKTLVLVAIFFSVFYAGRFSATSASCGLTDVSDFFGGLFSASDKTTPSGTVVLDTSVTETELITTPASSTPTVTTPTEPATTGPATSGSTAAAVEPVAEESNEEIITTYKKVALAIEGVNKIWKEPGVWGRMTGIEYTIKNSELGTIKPAYFIMTVKGYEDMEKRFAIPYTSETVKAGQTLQDAAAIGGSPSGFAFNKAQVNLQRVEIKLMMYDAADKVMALAVREVDLSGE